MTLFVTLFSTAFAQEQVGTIVGVIYDEEDQPLPFTAVQLQGTTIQTTTNEDGEFKLYPVPYGKYTLSTFLTGYHHSEVEVELKKKKLIKNIKLYELNSMLPEFRFEAVRSKYEMAFLSSIEGTALYTNKKNEVIRLDGVNANLSTNNSRQVFARVAGLNIWESDGAGLQLGIGGRGLSPNRTSNFNVRQNGYDISADALGYPESYYTPPSEAIDRIEVVRGAASLQYGTQFGGLLNFVMKKGPEDKPFQITSRNTVGSWGMFNTFNSIGGTKGKFNYYGFYQNKSGNGWRPNSEFEVEAAYGNVNYYITEKVRVGLEYTWMSYLAHQPGGLTDALFEDDPEQSIRERNWFNVNWRLAAATLDADVSDATKFNWRTFALNAERKALGFLGQITRIDPGTERDLIWGEFKNWGTEMRLLHRYEISESAAVLLVGGRYYEGFTRSRQGLANDGDGPDFAYLNPTNLEGSDYDFPSRNASAFVENVIFFNDHFTMTPGMRFEYISTESDGQYKVINRDLAGNIIFENDIPDAQLRSRSFALWGLGFSYKAEKGIEIYSNVSQNYRAINFNDIRIVNPNFVIDPNIQDEKGFNADIGFRGAIKDKVIFDATVFVLHYDNRIGEYYTAIPDQFGIDRVVRYRTNVADARNFGFESFAEFELLKIMGLDSSNSGLSVFANFAWIDAKYISSDEPAFVDKEVELVPDITLKTGVTYSYKSFSISYQLSHTGEHFTDATNAVFTPYAVDGLIPAYTVMDLSASFTFKKYVRLETGINNLQDVRYFTRRAAGYPGPGIIPSDARSFYATLQLQF